MRDYAVVSPLFWTGQTGKQIRTLGPEAQVVAMYLITSPHSNALGIYYLPLPLLAHETGLPFEGASKALQRVIEVGFCAYDPLSEVVWIYEMAKFQIGSRLSPRDNRIKWINKEYHAVPKNPFLQAFYDKYRQDFHLDAPRGFKAPSKPLRSQEQEQEQEQDQDIKAEGVYTPSTQSATPSAEITEPEILSDAPLPEQPDPDVKPQAGAKTDPCPHQEIIAAYHELLPELPKVNIWNDTQQAQLRARWREDSSRQCLDWWRQFFSYIRGSPFLMGQKQDFQADLEWLVRKNNFAKIANGRYHRGNGNGKYSEKTRRTIENLRQWMEEEAQREGSKAL